MGIGSQTKRRLIVSFLLIVSASAGFAACDPTRVDLRGDWGTVRFSVEVADDPGERSQGLMHRQSMPKSAGMLFVYDAPQPVSFWMRNTLIPLDMIFMDETGVVQTVHENAIPLDETGIFGGDAIQYVLEINGGLASRLGIEPGSQLRHPAIQPNPVWGCDAP